MTRNNFFFLISAVDTDYSISVPEYSGHGPRVLSRQGGAEVILMDEDTIYKHGDRVKRSEEVAMRYVKQSILNFPVPEVQHSAYGNSNNGRIFMDVVPGVVLRSTWDGLDDITKEGLCHETWALITQLRQIPKPQEQSHLFQCLADGSPTHDVLLEDLQNPPRPILNDEALRDRICERYHHFFGRRFTMTPPSMLLKSNLSVFTHGDIAPQNIMIDESNHITGIIDWENAGWYPDYWEYANIMRPRRDINWVEWMDRTATRRWDLSGIKAARRVLF